jgi:hypothetical protein
MFRFLSKPKYSVGDKEALPIEKSGPLSLKLLFELFLFSTAGFVFLSLFLKFLLTLQTSLLLWHYSITFTYRLFGISSSMESNWPVLRILIVFGFGVLAIFGAGLLLVKIVEKLGPANWKAKLILTWMAFLMVQILPMSLLAGTIFYDGFGIAYQWLFSSILARIIPTFLALAVCMILRPFWIKLFLKTAYSSVFLSENNYSQTYIKNSVILPWIAGVILLLPFVILHRDWFWLISLIGIGFTVLPAFGNNIPPRNFKITKSDKTIFRIRYPLIKILAIVALLLMADYVFKIKM